jgi:tripartite-type tricarboxylate transporter receptor subunit TctC
MGALALAGLAMAVPTHVSAQETYPNRDIHVVVGFPAGSGADVYARYFANKLAQATKVAVIVENKPGANSSIATEHVARSKPDGYTIFIGGSDSFGSPLYLFKKPPTDPRKDFIYVSPLVSQGFILTVAADKPYKNVAELTAAMKTKGDKASYPTTNNPALILGEAYKKAAGLNTVQIGYRTSADFLNDMMSGTLDWVWADPVFGLARIREGKFKPLAVSTAKRISSIPDIPTAKEAGIADIDMNLWWVTAVPAGTPQPIVDKLNALWTQIGKDPETKEFLAKNGAEPWTASLAETKALIDKEIKDWEVYVKLGKIEAQ